MASNFSGRGSGGVDVISLRKRYYQARIEFFLNPSEQNEMILNGLVREINKKNRPKKYSAGEDSELIKHNQEFEQSCTLIEEHYHRDVRELTMYEYVSRIESIKSKLKRQSENATNAK